MKTRPLVSLLLALVVVFGVSMSVAQSASADVSDVIGGSCKIATGSVIGPMGVGPENPPSLQLCDTIGKAAEEKFKEAWQDVWDSVLGDLIKSSADVAKWIIKKVLTVALLGPSLDLEATGLFGRDATLAGMLTWLGLVIAAAGAMWQTGRMALTGQSKHLGRAALGWVENTVLSAVGVAMIALLLSAGDALTTGLVNATFADDATAYEKIVAVMVPSGVSNPITMLCVIAILLLLGFIQLVMVFLRQSAIPIMCLLLPVAGGGRVGGHVTRQWAPKLITSICVVIAYKPILAIIICTGFAEFGHAKTLAEWLRGCATLILAILAPGPLTRIFAPFGDAVGSSMASGGMGPALSAAGAYFKGRKDGGRDGGEGVLPMTPMEYARYVEQSMGRNGGKGSQGREVGGQGHDAQAHAARNEANRVPRQANADDYASDPAVAGAVDGAVVGSAGQTTAAGAAVTPTRSSGIAIQVLDGVNNGIQNSHGQIDNGGDSQ
ncbi:hypothetical protein [Streptomyces thermospinosisporus]|uniref:hypothetical protein n=1 Tax=Streptomyces thermospinosisporus TaxID=161482 RepID=UPI0031D11540